MKAEIIADHRQDILSKGASAAGYDVVHFNRNPSEEDILICWNRKKVNLHKINIYENAGARVLIAENGYIGEGDEGEKLTALAIERHMGAGRWFVGTETRYLKQNIKIKPWRQGGEEIVILAQRGIGESKDLHWAYRLQETLIRKTDRPVRVRKHPGKYLDPLAPDLKNAWAVVTWSSAAAIKAIALGVPAFYLMPNWIGQHGAKIGIDELEYPFLGDRTEMFHRIGWAQWLPQEIENGEAMTALLQNDSFWGK